MSEKFFGGESWPWLSKREQFYQRLRLKTFDFSDSRRPAKMIAVANWTSSKANSIGGSFRPDRNEPFHRASKGRPYDFSLATTFMRFLNCWEIEVSRTRKYFVALCA